MPMRKTILHVDLDAFFCSVECLLNPDLRGKPFVVGGRPEERGVVASASYEARAHGIRSAMPTAQALRRYPGLIVLPSRHAVYREHSRRVMELLRAAAPLVEQLSIDEAFLDVSDDAEPGQEIAARLQREILRRFGLPTSWGVASNKLVAKIATQVGKPEGLITVPQGEEAAFLAPLPVDMLWGVGPKTRERLEGLGVHTIGDLARQPVARLRKLFGLRGVELAARARGVDDRPLVTTREPRSMSAETTFSRDETDGARLERALRRLSERVGRRLRRAGLAGHTVRVKVRWPDFETHTRQTRLEQPVDQDEELFLAARALFLSAWRTGRPVRLIGVAVADLCEPLRQLSLFDRSWEQEARLQRALDQLRARFGTNIVRRGFDGEGRKGPPAPLQGAQEND